MSKYVRLRTALLHRRPRRRSRPRAPRRSTLPSPSMKSSSMRPWRAQAMMMIRELILGFTLADNAVAMWPLCRLMTTRRPTAASRATRMM